MAWLGVMFALLIGYQLAVDVEPAAARALDAVGLGIWSVFLLEFGAKLWLAPNRFRFLRRHWLSAVLLLVPALRVLRFLRLLRLGRALPAARVISTSYRVTGTARRLLRSRLAYLAAMSTVATVAVAELAFMFEDENGRTFDSFGDALLWSASVVLAMQGDPVPETTGARLVMITGFAFGLVIIGTLAGTVGAFFLDDRREREHAEP